MPDRLRSYQPPRLTTSMPTTPRVYGTRSWDALRKAVLARDAYQCRACGKVVVGLDATVDHIDEMQNGGDALPTMDRLQCLCRSCNSRKGRANQGDTERRR